MTKPENRTQAIAETIVAEALANHGHAAPDPSRHLRLQIVTVPRSAPEVVELRR